MFLKPRILTLSDEELLEGFRKENDNKYLGELFGRYIRFVFLVCMKYLRDEDLAKDISMQVFEKISTDLHRFEVQNFKSWLHVVTKNTCLMHIRSVKHLPRQSEAEKKIALMHVENSSEEHHEYENHELRLEQLEKAITTLSDDQKQCIELFYLQEKTYKEVTDMTGFSMNQVKSHIQNGRRNLKSYLIDHDDILLMVFAMIYLNR